jgi:UDP-N-acetylglucosamine--N-acetylmuramyl-(pentapeptide) pyrophosphoryl-undecaprenol N-acetylglucosamine transferase
MRVLLTGGGTGGHVYPALAIAEALRGNPDLQTIEFLFVGTRGGLEASIVPKAGIPIAYVHAAPLQRRVSFAIIRTLVENARGFFETLALLHRFRPDVAIATGGYVTLPVIKAVWVVRFLRLSRARIVLLEPNARAGLANRLLRPFVDEVWLALASPAKTLRRNERLTGTPVRASFARTISPQGARSALGLDPEMTTIVVFGGSQGARTLNEAVTSLVLHDLPPRWQVLLVAGDRDYDGIDRRVRAANLPRVRIERYLDDPAAAYAAADLVVARAGASTVAELIATGTPAILVPYPHATGDHQRENAEVLRESGAARVLRDADVDARSLREALESALAPETLAAMRRAARAAADRDPRAAIVDRVKALNPEKIGRP